MHHQNHDVLRLSQAEQRYADSRLYIEMIWKPRLVNQQTLDFRLALSRRQRTQVNLLELKRPIFVDNH